MGDLLRGRLNELAAKYPEVIEEVRGMGLMIGLKLQSDKDTGTGIAALRDKGLLTVPAAENVIRLLPPLIVEESHIGDAMVMLDDVLSEMR